MSDRSQKVRCEVAVTPEVQPYINSAIARFSYLHPSTDVEVEYQIITLFADPKDDIDDLMRELRHTLYRQKIYAETLPLRSRLIQGVMGK